MASALQHHLCSQHSARQQTQVAYNAGAPSASHHLYAPHQDSKMAHPLLQNQYNSVEYPLDISNWQQQQQQRQHQHHAQYQQQHHMPYPVVSTNTNSAPPSQGHFWMSPSTLDSSFVWENNLPTDPFIVPKVEDSVLANSNLALNSAAIQGAWNNEVGFSSRSAWTSSCIGGLPTQGSANISSSDMAVLPSQDSVYSDNMDHKTYALGPVLSTDHASPAAEWSMVGSVFSPVTEGTSPESMASVPMLVPTRTISSSGLSTNSSEGSAEGGLMRTAALTESPDMYRQQSSAAFIFDGTPSCGSTYPYSHHTSPDTTQWYPPGYSPSHPGLPQPLTNAQIVSHKQTTRIEGGRYDLTKQSQAQWSGFVTEVPECDQQGEPPVMQNADSDTKRKTDDEILMKCKAEGITYKEIKKRLRTKVAESTLRGRYRALTKPRKDRVRKPVWTEKDITLLGGFVQRELARIGRRDPSLNRSARLAKIQWLKVVEHIEKHGSYRFGVATAKKKYLEISDGH